MKERLKKLLNAVKGMENKKKKSCIITSSALLAVLILTVILCTTLHGSREKVVYKESTVSKGRLAAGVTTTGSVDVGTTVQTFDLNISEFTGESNLSLSGGMGSMPGAPSGGMMNMMTGSGNNSSSSETRQLKVEEVYVEAGQEIQEGSPVLKLTEESVNTIRTQLEEDVASSKLVYDQALTSSKLTAVEAESNHSINVLYQTGAQAEYDQTILNLQNIVTQKEEAYTEATEKLEEDTQELAVKQSLLAEEEKVLANAEFTANGTSKEDALYWWITAWSTYSDAQTMVTQLEDELETLEETIETDKEDQENARIQMELAKKDLETGTIDATSQMELRDFYAKNAQEIYDVSIEQSNYSQESAKEGYEESKTKLEEFDQTIVEQVIYSSGSGLITDVSIAAGDNLTQDADLITLYDYDDVTITLSVEEGDMENASLGNPVNVTVAAFPEEVFKGKVTEIGDAEIDSNTNKTMYTVTATVENTNNLLYQDMTAEVTFVSEETSTEVIYVPNRAISETGDIRTVKVRTEDGSVEERKVICGFSDGVHTEIKEGLAEGETVLLESKVSNS